MNEIDLPYRLRRLRDKKGYKQKEIANYLCVSRSTYAYYENGKTEPSLDAIVKISNLYGISIDRLLRRNKDKRLKYLLKNKK